MTSLSTHDTKRSEDIRARLAALSELADEWLTFWDVFRATLTPSEPVVAWLLAQTMAATGPIEAPRLVEYALKAAREAGLATRWIDGDPDYEARLAAGVAKALGDAGFMQAWQQLDETLRIPGRTVALGQKLVALTAPGIPDCYQGTELWDDSLVDPDNRRPVDYAKRAELLNDAPIPALADDNDGRTKMQLVSETLRLRRVKPEAFRGYAPIVARGLAAGHAIAFDRGGSVTIATRLPVGLARLGGWSDTEIDVPRASTDLFTGRHLTPGAHKVGEILHRYPIALLVG